MSEQPDLNRALEIFQEFGPNRAIPVKTRWMHAFPGVTGEQMQQWEALFGELEAFAYQLGEQVLEGHMGSAEAGKTLAKRFPQLNDANVNHTISQAVYFAHK